MLQNGAQVTTALFYSPCTSLLHIMLHFSVTQYVNSEIIPGEMNLQVNIRPHVTRENVQTCLKLTKVTNIALSGGQNLQSCT